MTDKQLALEKRTNEVIRMLNTLTEAMSRYKSEGRLDSPIAINTQKLVVKWEAKLAKLKTK